MAGAQVLVERGPAGDMPGQGDTGIWQGGLTREGTRGGELAYLLPKNGSGQMRPQLLMMELS
jgi:hypothetical protein